MNFTREPIIETVITPREGCKLIVRSSKAAGQEEYLVDAVEVVSFGRSLFFRSLERPKSFLVPVSDYEVLELKETRAVLKNASPERSSIKIGGGREAAPFRSKESPPEESSSEQPSRPPLEGRNKRDRRRRGRRGRDRQEPPFPHSTEESAPLPPVEEEASLEPATLTEETKAPSFISKLFPPPPTLIKESLGRYKPPEQSDEDLFPQEDLPFEEPPSSQDKSETTEEE